MFHINQSHDAEKRRGWVATTHPLVARELMSECRVTWRRSNCRCSHTDGDRRDSARCPCNPCRLSLHRHPTTSRSIVSTQTDKRRAHLPGDRRSYAKCTAK